MLCSFGFLPKIIQPTRVTDHHSTLIDNIFNNNLTDETKSGNIYLTLSEHFSQFVSIKKEKIEYKKLNIIQHDYSKFQSQQFRDDVSIQNWNSDLPNVNELFMIFTPNYKDVLKDMLHLKTLSPKEIKLKTKPWITKEISKLIKFGIKYSPERKDSLTTTTTLKGCITFLGTK